MFYEDSDDSFTRGSVDARWSPRPQAFYTRPGMPNEWAKDLDLAAWNLTWASLEDPLNLPAPKGFRDKLEQSLRCELITAAGKRCTVRELASDPLMAFSLVHVYVHLSTWIGEKPLLLKMPGIRQRWRYKTSLNLRHREGADYDIAIPKGAFPTLERRAKAKAQKQERLKQALNNAIDQEIENLDAAQAWLKSKGFLK